MKHSTTTPYSLPAYELRLVRDKSIDMQERTPITTPSVAADIVQPLIGDADREHLIAVLLDTKNRPIAVHTVSIGGLNSAVIRLADVFKAAIVANAASIEMPLQRLTNRDRCLLDQMHRMQLLNLQSDVDFSGVLTAAGNIHSACYDESTGLITAVMDDSTTSYSLESADGGMTWKDGTDRSTGGGRPPQDVASNGQGTRIAIHSSVDRKITHHNGTAWQPSTIVDTTSIRLLSCDGARNSQSNTQFMAAGDSGTIYRSEDGQTFSDCSPAGLSGETIHVIAHTKSQAGADQWVAVTNTYAACSSDGGDSWTVGQHGLTVAPFQDTDSLYWDDSRSRWLLLLEGDALAVSEDGKSWRAGTPLPKALPDSRKKIVGDGQGNLLVAGSSLGAGALFGSCDGGQKWFDIVVKEANSIPAATLFAIAFGRGRFSVVWSNSGLSGLFSMAL